MWCGSVKITRFIPLFVLLVALALFFYFRLYEYLNFTTLEKHHLQLQQWTTQHYFLAVIGFMLIYIIAVAVSIPGVLFLTILGGFLFGPVWGVVYVVISATIGAVLIFMAVETALGKWLESKASGWVAKMEKGFQENAFNYLLILRLVPLFPFFIVNIVPALLNVRLRIFVLATFFGIIPGSFVYALVGNGLGHVFSLGQTPDLGIIFSPAILMPILGLALLSLIPLIYKKIKSAKT